MELLAERKPLMAKNKFRYSNFLGIGLFRSNTNYKKRTPSAINRCIGCHSLSGQEGGVTP